MESGDGARVKDGEPSFLSRVRPHSGLIMRRRGGALVDLNMTAEMKIIQFSENIDKFPAKFDKFLKPDGLLNIEIRRVIHKS